MKYLVLGLVVVLAGCSSATVSNVAAPDTMPHEVRSIALAPSGGPLADAIGIELVGQGYSVIDTAQTSTLLLRTNANENELMVPSSLRSMKAQGIDAVLNVRTISNPEGQPQSATVRLNSTHTGQVLLGLSWQNGWGGLHGSIADRVMTSDVVDAAKTISNQIRAKVPPPIRKVGSAE